MSSPPNQAHTPPFPGSLTLPKKRQAGPASSSGRSNKRRKPSTSSSSHPLRQTSFPPPEAHGTSRGSSFSPPIDGSSLRDGSLRGGNGARSVAGTSSIAGVGQKRGRKKAGAADAQSTAQIMTSAAGARGVSAAAEGRGRVGAEEEGEEEDEDGADDVEEVKEDEAAMKVAAEHMRMLIDAFDRDQMERYNVWRRVKLKKETVRRITNQTLSQSVSQAVVMVINGYTKAFIGEILERARDVQTEWLAASPILPTAEAKIKPVDAAGPPQVNGNSTMRLLNGRVGDYAPADEEVPEAVKELWAAAGPEKFVVEERDRGPLTPDHLREAVRRYKKDRVGGSAGFGGNSLQGKDVAAAKAGGRRLFR